MQLSEYVEAVKRDGARELKKLVGRPDAWRLFQVTFVDGSTSLIVGHDPDAKVVLGNEYRIVQPGRGREEDLPAYRSMRKLARSLARRDPCTEGEALLRVMKERPELFARFRMQWAKIAPKVEERKPWRVAKVTAIAAAALARLKSPAVAFAAGKAIAEHHVGERFPELRHKAKQHALAEYAPVIATGQKVHQATDKARQTKDANSLNRAQPYIQQAKDYLTRHERCSDRQLARWLHDKGYPGDARSFVRHARHKKWV